MNSKLIKNLDVFVDRCDCHESGEVLDVVPIEIVEEQVSKTKAEILGVIQEQIETIYSDIKWELFEECRECADVYLSKMKEWLRVKQIIKEEL